MPIINLQRRQTEVGRIRIGEVKDTGRRKQNGDVIVRPAKLDSFRFTTASRALADHVQALYGGTVAEWEPQGGGAKQWEVTTTAKAVPVIVPPNSVSQWYEMWSGGGCVRRCDGERNVLTDKACECPLDPAERAGLAQGGNACKPTTRINVMLADIPGIGVWRLETHGFYAATELPAVAELLAAGGGYIPARLELQERSAKRPKANGQGTETRRWMVPVLHVDASPKEMLSGNAPRIELTASEERPALPAAPAEVSGTLDQAPDVAAHERPEHYRSRAKDAKALAEVQAIWRDAKAAGVLDDALAAYLRQRGEQLKPAPEPTPAVESPIDADADEPNPDGTWLAIITAAGEHGWSSSDVEAKVIARFNKSSDECNGWQLSEFLDAVTSGEVS